MYDISTHINGCDILLSFFVRRRVDTRPCRNDKRGKAAEEAPLLMWRAEKRSIEDKMVPIVGEMFLAIFKVSD